MNQRYECRVAFPGASTPQIAGLHGLHEFRGLWVSVSLTHLGKNERIFLTIENRQLFYVHGNPKADAVKSADRFTRRTIRTTRSVLPTRNPRTTPNHFPTTFTRTQRILIRRVFIRLHVKPVEAPIVGVTRHIVAPVRTHTRRITPNRHQPLIPRFRCIRTTRIPHIAPRILTRIVTTRGLLPFRLRRQPICDIFQRDRATPKNATASYQLTPTTGKSGTLKRSSSQKGGCAISRRLQKLCVLCIRDLIRGR